MLASISALVYVYLLVRRQLASFTLTVSDARVKLDSQTARIEGLVGTINGRKLEEAAQDFISQIPKQAALVSRIEQAVVIFAQLVKHLTGESEISGSAIERARARMAHEIVEADPPPEALAFIGICTNGVPLAQRLAVRVGAILQGEFPVGEIDISMHRDDLALRETPPAVGPSNVSFDVTDKTIVLVDDVLFTGRSIRAAMDEIANRPGVAARFVLEPGEMVFWHNFQVMHARTAFKDTETRKRLLLRLWVHAHEKRPMAPSIRERGFVMDRVHALGPDGVQEYPPLADEMPGQVFAIT